MRTLAVAATVLASAVMLAGVSPRAEAAHIVVGIGLSGIAVVAPAPVVVAPLPYYYGPRVYAPVIAAPVFGWHAHYVGGYARPWVAHRGWR